MYLWSFCAKRAPAVIQNTPYFKAVEFEILLMLLENPHSQTNNKKKKFSRVKSWFRKLIGKEVDGFEMGLWNRVCVFHAGRLQRVDKLRLTREWEVSEKMGTADNICVYLCVCIEMPRLTNMKK